MPDSKAMKAWRERIRYHYCRSRCVRSSLYRAGLHPRGWNLQRQGWKSSTLIQAGFTAQELIQGGFSKAELDDANELAGFGSQVTLQRPKVAAAAQGELRCGSVSGEEESVVHSEWHAARGPPWPLRS